MKEMVSVVMIGSIPKPRTYKRIAFLKRFSKMNLLCWDRVNETQLNVDENVDYPVNVIKLKAANDPLKRAVPYAKFTKKALKLLEEIKPDLIQVEGLDILKIADKYKRKSKKKVVVVYEVPDLRRLITEKQTNPVKKIAQKYVIGQEKKLCNRTDLIIMTSEMFYETHYKGMVDRSKFIYVPNVPEYRAFENFKKYSGDDFVIGWIGGVRYKKQMKMMLNAVDTMDCKALVAGYEKEPIEISPLCESNPRVERIGKYNYDTSAAELYGKCSVIYAVYDATKINEQIALPNKLYEAVYCELPIIVAKNTYLSKVVEEWDVGLAVDCNNQDEITEALERLRSDKALYQHFVEQCRIHKADIDMEKYNKQLEAEIKKRFDK